MTDDNRDETEHDNKGSLLIAIDGTAGAGKTTIGQMLASGLGIAYLDTGAMYRAVTLQALENKVSLDPVNVSALASLARNLAFVSRDATADEATDGRQYTVLLGGQDVSQALRSPEVEKWVSVIAAVPQVRTELVERQREIARHSPGGIVMMGRDIGSVVLPDADLKVYLDASPEVRATRRSRQETAKTAEEALRNLKSRDKIDSQRASAPLVIAPGALVISTDNLNQQQVFERILEALKLVLEKRK
ncbi:MAG TPA: (d)CMP kinase [Chloroflexia bacterium]|nr:(d)CMP kinase [Chloroflexia bacterium]